MILLLLILVFPAIAADRYVSPSGSGDGSSVLTPASFATAAGCFSGGLAAGETVWLRGGTYADPGSGWTIACNGTLNKPIRFVSYPGERADFDLATNTEGNGSQALEFTGDYLTIRGTRWFSSHNATRQSRQHPSGNAGLPFRPGAINSAGTGKNIINNWLHDNGGAFNGPNKDSYNYGNYMFNEGAMRTTDWKRSDNSLTQIVVSSNVATATTGWAHGLSVGGIGASMAVSGATVDADLNASFAIASTPTPTTFTWTTTNVADGTYTEAGLRILSDDEFAKGQTLYMEHDGGAWNRAMHNVMFQTFGGCHQLQASASGGKKNINVIFQGNTATLCGRWQGADDTNPYADYTLFGQNARCENNRIRGNYIWGVPGAARGVGIQYSTRGCKKLVVENNHIVNAPHCTASDGEDRVTLVSHTGNKYYGGNIDAATNTAISGNTHSATRSTSATPDIYYEKNLFEAPRCKVDIFRHDSDTSENIDPSQCGFVSGDPYEVIDNFNPLGAALVAGIYAGGTISVPTNRSDAQVAQPIGEASVFPRIAIHPNNTGGASGLASFTIQRPRDAKTVTLQFFSTTATSVRVLYGLSNDVVPVDAHPIEVTLERPTVTINTVNVSTAAQVTLNRPNNYPVHSKQILIGDISDSCWRTALSRAHTVDPTEPLDNVFTPSPSANTSGCSPWAACGANCSSAKVLFFPNTLSIPYYGSPLFTGDSFVGSGGSGDWTQANVTDTNITSGNDLLIELDAVTLTPVGANNFSTTGTAFTSTAHGLSVNDFVWAIGATSTNQIRKVTAVADADNATLDAAFSSDVSNQQWRRIESDFEAFSGTVTTAAINRNPLMFDIRSAYFDPEKGINPTVTISGGTGCWAGANGTWTATLVVNARFTIPFDASACGSSVGQTFTVTTPRALDFPKVIGTFSGNYAQVSVPHYRGKMWYQYELLDGGGAVTARSDRIPITVQ